MTEEQAYGCDYLMLDDSGFLEKRVLRCRGTGCLTRDGKGFETTLDFCRICPDWEHVEQKSERESIKT
jgi:hypothetical protein